ncbi:MAG: STE24 endopeptidase [Candidatus Magnetoglobus multicellularis str. Araruama]|uniref:STE24 endopeptidase n=1 Tax=Candidatus Magnetoglobus multicellularis str. Araruama TaxID=890399 RepID=A0A1V1P8J0_9BACT|nr:MAG: STE24 endopeptidase [Candidatus Magnetoglobus multicellularis str. Araruama]
MNLIAWIILIALIVDYLLNFIADIVNLKQVSPVIPEAFKNVYDPERYARSQEYLKVNTRFEWLVSSLDLIIILVFWFTHGFAYLDDWIRSYQLGSIGSGLMYVSILGLIKLIISLPFSIYSTFVIEERFGFNKTTVKTFILDLIKGLALSIVLGAPLLSGILYFFDVAGDNAWWYCWLAVTIFVLIVQFIAPTWIMPLFNKFTPLEAGELRNMILNYAQSIQFSVQNIFIIDGSKRSSKSNAFFTGFGKNKRIALFDTLVEQLNNKELVSVLAHEMGHYKKKHIWINMGIGIAYSGVMFYLLSFFISYNGLFDAFFMNQPSVYAGMIFFGMLLSPIDFFLGLLLQSLSRYNEYQADQFAATTTESPDNLISALKQLSVQNLSNLTPHPLYVFLNYSHPPVLQRIQRLKATEH